MSNAPDTAADQLLESLSTNVVKTKTIYDGSNRAITRYEAVANANNGQACIKTSYTYVGATTQIDATKEEMDVWQSAWDI